jgi:hypothetical protein
MKHTSDEDIDINNEIFSTYTVCENGGIKVFLVGNQCRRSRRDNKINPNLQKNTFKNTYLHALL